MAASLKPSAFSTTSSTWKSEWPLLRKISALCSLTPVMEGGSMDTSSSVHTSAAAVLYIHPNE